MNRIDPTARIEDGAVIGDDVTIGPYCIIGSQATIGPGSTLISHVNVGGQTTIAENCTIYPFVSLGGPRGPSSGNNDSGRLEIGKHCTFRESVTIQSGTVAGGGVTSVGDRCFFMNNSSVDHNCRIGNDVIFATSTTLGENCQIGDFVFIGGLSIIRDSVRIGSQVMIGGLSGVHRDIIPFGLVNGDHAHLQGLNIVGMKRRKFTKERLQIMRSFYQKLFVYPGRFADRLAAVQSLRTMDTAIAEALDFIARGQQLCMPLHSPD
ncbi:MAG: acyl-ACP--UDP-N-acetylglucosamine O-acyltransferase [Xanthobacteraceae bacterium]|nr:acyl-ACP--UDP-N-acetylglucosamine O-acyltransferase [Xanthobacteraceae bacterium]